MTYRLPSLNALRAFEAAARNRGFKAAAVELGVSPGAISQQVKKLEHSLGTDLFQRLPHGLLLTDAGQRYLPKVTKVFDDLTLATEEIAPDMNGRKFTVGIGRDAGSRLPKGWPLGVDTLRPYVRSRVSSANVRQLESGEIDCLVSLNEDPPKNVHMVDLIRDGTPANPSEVIRLFCKPSLANCRQISELISALQDIWR